MASQSSDHPSHWHKLYPNFQASPKEFYAKLQQTLESRNIPGVEYSRVDWHEGGFASVKREYLRIKRDRLVVDICGAPFGTSFFFSEWAVTSGAGNRAQLLIGLASLLVPFYVLVSGMGWLLGALAFCVAIPLLLWVLASAGLEDWMLDTPIIGPLYLKLFHPFTYYKVDTALMFIETVHQALIEVVEGMTVPRGIRALSDAERKPILSEFYRKVTSDGSATIRVELQNARSAID